MKNTGNILMVGLGAALLLAGCGKNPVASSPPWSPDNSAAAAQLKPFLAAQETQARALAKQDGNHLPADFDAYYHAAGTGDWQGATNLFGRMSKDIQNDESLRGGWWQATLDDYGVFELFPSGDKYTAAFGHDIIQSIPDGSIYLGGTDPGRFAVTALMEAHAEGKPFFMLSQNPIADAAYLHYLRSMYDGKIHLLADEDLEKALQEYLAEAQHRLAHDRQFPNEPKQVRPGDENVSQNAGGQVQLRSQLAVIGVRELLTKTLFDRNPDREFYVEEREVAAFMERIHLRKDLGGFEDGDVQFVRNEEACKMFSKLRSSIAGNYAWRAQHAANAGEQKRMNDAADFAFRQAWALCPYSPESLYRYVNLLLSEGRTADAILIAETAAKMPPMQGANGEQLRGMIAQLKQMQKSK